MTRIVRNDGTVIDYRPAQVVKRERRKSSPDVDRHWWGTSKRKNHKGMTKHWWGWSK